MGRIIGKDEFKEKVKVNRKNDDISTIVFKIIFKFTLVINLITKNKLIKRYTIE